MKFKSPVNGENVAGVPGLPLSALLSQVLVAFTIEFDNEFERQMQHRTTNHGSTAGSLHAPWLVSLVMWENCMRFVGDEGITVAELERAAGTKTNLNGMERWGYVVVQPAPTDNRSKPPHTDWVIRATAAGRRAQEVWRPLFGVIEKRWRDRFGADEIDKLRKLLWDVSVQFEVELPNCLPILGYGLFSKELHDKGRALAGHPAVNEDSGSRLPLSTLLSRVLLAFAIEFENESDLSLAISANLLRVLDEKEVRMRDLPLLTGVSKEAINMAMGFLKKKGVAVVDPDPTGSRAKVALLTPKGSGSRKECARLLGVMEKRWQTRFGKDTIRNLRESLERLVGDPNERHSLWQAVEPHPGGWRASIPKSKILPHYPMVLHRGGFPDGS